MCYVSVMLLDVQAVEGKRVELPCNVTPPGHDKLYMVLWFKADAGIPLYRLFTILSLGNLTVS